MRLRPHLQLFRDAIQSSLMEGRFYEDPVSPQEVAQKIIDLCDLLISHIDPDPRDDEP